jgi:signal transduction histidine kinase/ActR/RegA family two-component response regulator
MGSLARKGFEHAVRQLDRRNAWMWCLAALVMFLLGLAVATVYMTQAAEGFLSPFPAPETRGLLAAGLCGIVALFCLYVLLKQGEMQRLRGQLFEIRVREETVRSRLLGLSALLDGIPAVAAQVDLESMLETLAEHVRSTLGADQVSIMLITPGTAELECRAVVGQDAAFVRGARARVGSGIAGWVAEHNRPLVLNHDEMITQFPSHQKPGRDIASALCIPLAVNDAPLGVLNINRLGPATQFTDEDAALLGVFAAHAAIAIQHVLERHHSEREQQRQKMEALGRLAGGVAHDFNNLLTVILGYASALAAQSEPRHPTREAAEKIRNAAESCAALTRQLLAFGHKQVLHPEVLDLNGCITGVAELMRRTIRENVEVSIALSPDAGSVLGDRSQLEQVIVSLALHARDAMPGGGVLAIETAGCDVDAAEAESLGGVAPGPYAVLSVRDTGGGMAPEALAHVFEPFFAPGTGFAGGGIGLASVHGIVTQIGGEISVTSDPGRGTEFRVYLPRDSKPARAGRLSDEPASLAEGHNVLLVEDDDVVRTLTAEILELSGFKVFSARHGADAIAISERCVEPIDLLLTDIIMPGMSGAELAHLLRAARPRMKVLYMSGYTGDEIDRLGVTSPGTAFLQKPFTLEALTARVQEALAQSSGAADPDRSEPDQAAA